MKPGQFQLRAASTNDIPEIIKMYKNTVRAVNAKDYTPSQIEVWAEGAENKARWESAINEQYFVLAEDNTPLPSDQTEGLTDSLPSQEGNKLLAGFASIAKDGYLDFMYVSKDHQRCGVASVLLDEIEKKALEQNNKEIYSHVSKTAKGFFLRRGYEHVKDIEDPYKGEIFINALMIKKLN